MAAAVHVAACGDAVASCFVVGEAFEVLTERDVLFGVGIHDRKADPMELLRHSLRKSGWRISASRSLPDANQGRRQVRQFQQTPKKSATEYDVYCRTA